MFYLSTYRAAFKVLLEEGGEWRENSLGEKGKHYTPLCSQ